jgi:hypothetical protein
MEFRRILVIFSFLLTSIFTYGQDLIIRITGDTIHCKIDKADDSFVHYRTLKTRKGQVDLISTKEVLRLVYGAGMSSKPIPDRPASKKDTPFIKLFGGLGFSRLLSNEEIEDPLLDDYDSDLRWGLSIEAGLAFTINAEWSIGFLYSNSTYENDLGTLNFIPAGGGPVIVGQLSDDISIQYFASNAIYRIDKQQSGNAFELSFGIGYTSFTNSSEFIYPINFQANGVGIHASGAFELSLGQGFYIPLRASFKGFSVGNIDVAFPTDSPTDFQNDIRAILNTNPNFDVARIEITAGLSLSF